MQYTKLFFLSALLVVANTVFTADVPSNRNRMFRSRRVNIHDSSGRYGNGNSFVYDMDDTISEIAAQYKLAKNIPTEYMVFFLQEGERVPDDKPYEAYKIEDLNGLTAIIKKPQNVQTVTKPSSSSSSSSSSSIATLQEVALPWFEAKSKKTYFMDKYKKLEPLVGFNASDYDGYRTFKKDPSYDYLRDTIIGVQMSENKSYIVIRTMLKNAASESSADYQLLTKLVQPAMVRAIAALQKVCGKGRRAGFQFDEYDKTQLQAYLNPDQIDPFIKRVSPGIDMTIYRFLYNVIGELDDVPVVKDSPLYKILDTFDNSLTAIRGS